MPTKVARGSHCETFVRDQVESGRYNTASEVVRAGPSPLASIGLQILSDRLGCIGKSSNVSKRAQPWSTRNSSKTAIHMPFEFPPSRPTAAGTSNWSSSAKEMSCAIVITALQKFNAIDFDQIHASMLLGDAP